MKKLLFAILPFAAILLLNSCTDEVKSIAGPWQVSEATVESTKLSDNLVALTQEEYKNTYFDFRDDGTGLFYRGPKQMPCTYVNEGVGKTLTITSNPAGSWEEKYEVLSIGDGEIKLKQPIDKDGSSATLVLIPM